MSVPLNSFCVPFVQWSTNMAMQWIPLFVRPQWAILYLVIIKRDQWTKPTINSICDIHCENMLHHEKCVVLKKCYSVTQVKEKCSDENKIYVKCRAFIHGTQYEIRSRYQLTCNNITHCTQYGNWSRIKLLQTAYQPKGPVYKCKIHFIGLIFRT